MRHFYRFRHKREQKITREGRASVALWRNEANFLGTARTLAWNGSPYGGK